MTQLDGTEQTWPTVPTSHLRTEVYREMAEAVATGRPPARCHLDGARAVTEILSSIATAAAAVAA